MFLITDRGSPRLVSIANMHLIINESFVLLVLFLIIVLLVVVGVGFFVVVFAFFEVSRKIWSQVASKCCVAAGNGTT